MDIKTRLANSLEELMLSKSIDEIHVREIAEHAGFSRPTFYKYFIDKYDLLNWTYKNIFQITAYKMLDGISWTDALLALLNIFETKKIFIQNAFSSTDVNGLQNYNISLSMEILTQMLKEKGVNTTDQEIMFLLNVYTRGCAQVMMNWVKDGMKTPKEQIAKMFKRSWPAELADYID